MGRACKLTPERQAKICGLIRAGHYMKTAAMASGISEDTFHDWKSKGESAKSGKFRAFYDAVVEAEGQSELLLVDRVLKEGGAKGALEILKRRFPERWGDRHRLEHATPDGPLRHSHGGDPDQPSVTVKIGDAGSVWDPQVHGVVHEATEDDMPDDHLSG